MLTYQTKQDPCMSCSSSYSTFHHVSYKEKAASQGFGGSSIYASYFLCPTCMQMYVSYDRDRTDFGHPKRYSLSQEEKAKIMKSMRYKEWVQVKKVTTEYGMYRKRGKVGMHKPFNGEIYALIEKALVEGLKDDLARLEMAYPEKVRMVREFDV